MIRRRDSLVLYRSFNILSVYTMSKSVLLSVVVRISVPASLSPSVIVHSATGVDLCR
jgi:hypothetical protein